MLDRYEALVPIDVTNDISKGTLLEYVEDDVNGIHHYAPLSTGEPAGVLMEDVSAGQSPAAAKVLFFGIVYEDELAAAPDEDTKAKLRKVGIFVEKRL